MLIAHCPQDVGDLQDPYYWWVGGALWGSMLDYYYYTQDPTYNDVVIEALLSGPNMGENRDYVPKEHALEEGNDDLFFWGSAIISAAERNFPQPDKSLPSWLDLGANIFNGLVDRWNTTHCGGGLTWQIYPDNPNGMDYKNSVSNGGFFQLAARLARATGNDTYLDWAEKLWDWTTSVDLISDKSWHVFDGVGAENNCTVVNYDSYTYTSGIYLYGAAILADHTGDDKWTDRTKNLLKGADWFFGPFDNATDIMYESQCEGDGQCSADASTHKGFLSRYMWHTAILMPDLREDIEKKLIPSAEAAAQSCSGGRKDRACSLRWYVGGYDGNTGLGQQMCALETIQGLLSLDPEPPLKGSEIKVVREKTWKPLEIGDGEEMEEQETTTTKPSGPEATDDDDEDAAVELLTDASGRTALTVFAATLLFWAF